MKLVYFAWVRERIGLPEETLAIPADLATYLPDLPEQLGWAHVVIDPINNGAGQHDGIELALGDREGEASTTGAIQQLAQQPLALDQRRARQVDAGPGVGIVGCCSRAAGW